MTEIPNIGALFQFSDDDQRAADLAEASVANGARAPYDETQDVEISTGELFEHVAPNRQLAPLEPLNQQVAINSADWSGILGISRSLIKSHLLPSSVNTPEKAAAIILTGRELGIPAMAAFRTIDVINGVPALRPQMMLGLIRRSGLLESFAVEDDGNACTCTMKRKGDVPHSETFSMADAVALNLATKDNWKKQPETMRKWKAIGACARVVFPDIILGLYTAEELGADISVSVEEGDTTPAPPPPANAFSFDGESKSDENVVEGEFRDLGAPTNAFQFS